jgi:chemotaxis protein MotB
MPLSARRSRRSSIDIWPGFVDALAQLLMVVIFVLLVFTAGQFYLSAALSGRDKALKELEQQVSELSDLLALERRTSDELRTGSASLSEQLKATLAERDALTGRLAELESLRRDIEALKAVRADLEKQVGALTSSQQKSAQDAGALRDRTKELEAKLASEQEKTLLAQKEVDSRDVRLRALGDALGAEQQASRAARAQVEQLTAAVAELRQQLAKIVAALDVSEAKVKEQQGQIADLGRRLNVALATKVQELARYRSEFFGRLREILGDRPDIRVVGDRFVFQSEVLFAPGNAELAEPAKKQLEPVIAALKEISAKIPAEINWVLRVDGHTDRRPINNDQFASNWELSTARAISVVRYAVAQGIPANRVAAAGFADNQPLDTGNGDEAYRRNRRIELKLTER